MPKEAGAMLGLKVREGMHSEIFLCLCSLFSKTDVGDVTLIIRCVFRLWEAE